MSVPETDPIQMPYCPHALFPDSHHTSEISTYTIHTNLWKSLACYLTKRRRSTWEGSEHLESLQQEYGDIRSKQWEKQAPSHAPAHSPAPLIAVCKSYTGLSSCKTSLFPRDCLHEVLQKGHWTLSQTSVSFISI